MLSEKYIACSSTCYISCLTVRKIKKNERGEIAILPRMEVNVFVGKHIKGKTRRYKKNEEHPEVGGMLDTDVGGKGWV